MYRGQGEFRKARQISGRITAMDSQDAWAWFWLAWDCKQLGQLEQARDVLREGFRQTRDPLLLGKLGRTYERIEQGREEMRSLLEQVRSESAGQERADRQGSEQVVRYGDLNAVMHRLLEVNLERIAYEVTARDIRFCLITYPNMPHDHPVNQVLRRVGARQDDVLLIDAAAALASRLADPSLDLMSRDGFHPNARGYALLARFVLDSLNEAKVGIR